MTEAEGNAWAPPGFIFPERHGTIRDRIEAGTHFNVQGEGPAVVLIHGVGLDMEMWEKTAEALKSDYTVIRYDLLGHGSSRSQLVQSLSSRRPQLRGRLHVQRFEALNDHITSLAKAPKK